VVRAVRRRTGEAAGGGVSYREWQEWRERQAVLARARERAAAAERQAGEKVAVAGPHGTRLPLADEQVLAALEAATNDRDWAYSRQVAEEIYGRDVPAGGVLRVALALRRLASAGRVVRLPDGFGGASLRWESTKLRAPSTVA
jgi:hypothetical protein